MNVYGRFSMDDIGTEALKFLKHLIWKAKGLPQVVGVECEVLGLTKYAALSSDFFFFFGTLCKTFFQYLEV